MTVVYCLIGLILQCICCSTRFFVWYYFFLSMCWFSVVAKYWFHCMYVWCLHICYAFLVNCCVEVPRAYTLWDGDVGILLVIVTNQALTKSLITPEAAQSVIDTIKHLIKFPPKIDRGELAPSVVRGRRSCTTGISKHRDRAGGDHPHRRPHPMGEAQNWKSPKW